MKKVKKIVDMPPCINTVTCWMVKAPFRIRMRKGKRGGMVRDGFATQTPRLYDKNQIKIARFLSGSRQQVFILKEREVRELVDSNGNAFWR